MLVTERANLDAHAKKEPSWAKKLTVYREADNKRASFELVVTGVLFCAAWALASYLATINWVFAVVPILAAAAMIVRLFAIQHDCGHGAMFSNQTVNNWVGRALGVVTMTPYEYWRHCHALHHASSGNLDKRGFGEIDTLTVEEFNKLTRWQKILYRLYRHPIVMFGIGPSYLFVLRHRLPVGLMNKGWKPWISTFATNAGIAVMFASLIYWLGLFNFLSVHLPIVVFGGTIGIWLFYVQHQYDETEWHRSQTWNREDAALNGSSYYVLPAPVQWATGNIGIHHVHHLSSGIPFYKLPRILNDHPDLAKIGRLTFRESLNCIRLALWDETTKELISFRQYSKRATN